MMLKIQIFQLKIWRYYLLINRPEHTDTIFTWKDFGSKNNNELLPSIGNPIQRSTKFCYTEYE